METRFKLQQQIDYLFRNAPVNRATYELKEELMANAIDKMDDLMQDGMSEDDAINMVVSGIGNVDELIAQLPEDKAQAYQAEYDNYQRGESAKIVAISVGLYILAGAVFFTGILIASMWYEPALFGGLILAALMCIPPTCMLVYNSYNRPQYNKADNSVVENFKEFSNNQNRRKHLRRAVSSVIWTLCLVMYFIVSFATGAWWITWIAFLIALCCEAIVALVFSYRELK